MLDRLFEPFGALADFSAQPVEPWLWIRSKPQLLGAGDFHSHLNFELFFRALHAQFNGLAVAEFAQDFDDLVAIRHDRAVDCPDDIAGLYASLFGAESSQDLLNFGSRE